MSQLDRKRPLGQSRGTAVFRSRSLESRPSAFGQDMPPTRFRLERTDSFDLAPHRLVIDTHYAVSFGDWSDGTGPASAPGQPGGKLRQVGIRPVG
jgi:hypothetical protein